MSLKVFVFRNLWVACFGNELRNTELIFLATSRRHATLEDAVQEITGVASDDDIIGGAETVNNATGERDNIPQV